MLLWWLVHQLSRRSVSVTQDNFLNIISRLTLTSSLHFNRCQHWEKGQRSGTASWPDCCSQRSHDRHLRHLHHHHHHHLTDADIKQRDIFISDRKYPHVQTFSVISDDFHTSVNYLLWLIDQLFALWSARKLCLNPKCLVKSTIQTYSRQKPELS